LRLVTTLRKLGLPAVEAGRVARLCLERSPEVADVSALLGSQRNAIRQQREELSRLESELLDLEATLASTTRGGKPKQPGAPITVLFLCNANSGRSQIAEALLRESGGAAFSAYSAGANPKPVSPLAVEALAEAGIDWQSARSKPVSEFASREFEYVVALSDSMRETCATLPGPHSTLHWQLPDPGEVAGTHEHRLSAYRQVRLELSLRLRPFIDLALRTAAVQA
jgi:arsenate reductase